MATDPGSSQDDQATIVCCIERGRLEPETLLMLETLRKWGGPLGRSRVLAVMPRRDLPLLPETVKGLEALGAELHDGSRYNKTRWFNWYGKVVAARVAEREAKTPVVIWLDSDALILAPLVELGLPHGDDFAARQEFRPSWEPKDSGPFVDGVRYACETLGMSWDELPVHLPEGPHEPQRLSFNAGIYAFRRGLGFSEAYTEFTDRLLAAHVASHGGNFWFNEQIAVMLAMLKLGMKFRELPQSENHMVFRDHIDGPTAAPFTPDARLVHYSGSMLPEFWPRFLERMRREKPEQYDWIAGRGPIPNPVASRDPIYLVRKIYRKLQSKAHTRKCREASAARLARAAGAG
ncbi:hypothetical protein [Paludisphaera mucosa]|uniref:Uncharacterized protein n=1 Tax=Paludisphaera mucosa TaxID=3030827 RepID=A0ABT6FIX2_9BACT|nr:hypothetical protein [Paludisphaera mucosa]MDG3007527.1 hypothetical protein [Paludisphaera mucosa]